MSEIKVDTLTGKTTANDITVTVGASATAKLEQGLVKHWIVLDTRNSDYINDSFNTSSFSDDGVGRHLPSFTNNMSSINYANSGFSVTYSGSDIRGHSQIGYASGGTGNYTKYQTDTDKVRFHTGNPSTGTYGDADGITLITIGDLA